MKKDAMHARLMPLRDEMIMRMLLEGVPGRRIAQLVGVCEGTVRNARTRMTQKAERDIKLARLKLWRESVGKAA